MWEGLFPILGQLDRKTSQSSFSEIRFVELRVRVKQIQISSKLHFVRGRLFRQSVSLMWWPWRIPRLPRLLLIPKFDQKCPLSQIALFPGNYCYAVSQLMPKIGIFGNWAEFLHSEVSDHICRMLSYSPRTKVQNIVQICNCWQYSNLNKSGHFLKLAFLSIISVTC